MSARTIAGWTTVISGALLIASMLVSSIVGAGFGVMGRGVVGVGPGMMGPGMMGMGQGMMGFGNSVPAASPIPGATEVRVATFNFGFSPSEVHLPRGTDVNLTLSNPAASGVVHDLTIPALGIHVVASPGEARTVGLRALPAGRYDAYCSVPGHADAGMRATVIVD